MKRLTLLALVAVISSCGSGDSAQQATAGDYTDTTAQDTSMVFKQAQAMFYSMPSPLEMTTLIQSAGGDFQKSLLHDANKANQYQGLLKRSLALGAYGADMSYSVIYNQQPEAVKYLAACKRLGEAVGIHEAFSANLIERANANLSNRDSMLNIMTEMYWQTNSQLKEENRDQIALLIMAGGWAEGLYLGTQVVKIIPEDQDLQTRMAEQKYTAMQLMELFSAFQGDPVVEEAHALFKPVLEHFQAFTISNAPATTKTMEDGTVVIGGETHIDYTQEDLDKLSQLAAELRAKIIES